MTGDPLFWALAAAFAAILTGMVIAFDPRLAPFRQPLRAAIGLVVGGIVAVCAVTAAKVLG